MERLPEFDQISDYLFHYASSCPEREALVLDEWRISYRGFAEGVNRCARALLANGVGRGDRVAMLCTPRPEYSFVYVATIAIGAIWVGLNPRYKIDELRYVIRDAQPRILFSLSQFEGRDYRPDLERLKSEHDCVKRIVTFPGNLPDISTSFVDFVRDFSPLGRADLDSTVAGTHGSEPAAIIYTSGSTGRPKGALLTHRSFTLGYRIQCQHWLANPLRLLNNLPINHVAGLGDLSTFALVAGGTQVFMERFNAELALRAIEREKVSFLMQFPTQFQLLLECARFPYSDLSGLQVIAWGGAAVPRDLVQRLSALGARLYNSYGMTEVGAPITYTEEGASIDVLTETVGRPDPRFAVRIANRDGSSVVRGEIGEVQARGDFVMRGYYNQPEATAEAIDRDGWFHTGDLAFERPDGNYQLAGRLKEMFKSGGYNIAPREVEVVLERHPGIAMAVVVAVPDRLYQEVGHAFLIAKAGVSIAASDIGSFCHEHLANYKVPKEFHFLAQFPVLANGKVDRRALQAEAVQYLNSSAIATRGQ